MPGTRPRKSLGGLLGRMAAWSSAEPLPALMGLLLLTAAGAYGIAHLSFQGDTVDLLPRGNPNTEGALAVDQHFSFFYDNVPVYLPIDPQKWQAANGNLPCRQTPTMPGNGWDEVYIRGANEFVGYMKSRVPSLNYTVSIAAIVKTLNWSNTGVPGAQKPQDSAYAMPGTSCQAEGRFYSDWTGSRQAQGGAGSEILSPDGRTLQIILVFDPAKTHESRLQVGHEVIQALQDYPTWAKQHGKYQAFQTDKLAAEGVPVVEAHAATLTLQDLELLAPLVFLAIVGLLFWAFRSWQAVVATFSTLGAAFIWSTGLLGYLGIPIANLNLTYVPIILGIGVDYSIHFVNAVLGALAEGADRTAAYRQAGKRVGTATSVATITTIGGLGVFALGPSPMMTQVAVASLIAVVTVYLLTFSWLPAALSLLGVPREKPYQPSGIIPRIAELIREERPIFAVALVLLLMGSAVAAQDTTIASFGNPAMQFPEGDLVQVWHQRVHQIFYGGNSTEQALIILRGNVETPQAHHYMENLASAWKNSSVGGSRIADLPFVLEGYLTIRNGTGGAVSHTILAGAQGNHYDYPKSRQGILRLLNDTFDSPFSNFVSYFTQPPGYHITIVTSEVQQANTYSDAKRVWHGLDQIVAQADQQSHGRPDGVKVSYFGSAAFSYLFIHAELPWVNTLFLVGTLFVAVAAYLATRSLRGALAVLLVSLGSSLTWLGLLAILDIPLSPFLFLPLVILIAVGTDDAIHLVLSVNREGEGAYATVGKAVNLTTITSLVAFLLFTRMRHVGLSQSMLATAVAIATAWIFTVVLVPLLVVPGSDASASAADEEATA